MTEWPLLMIILALTCMIQWPNSTAHQKKDDDTYWERYSRSSVRNRPKRTRFFDQDTTATTVITPSYKEDQKDESYIKNIIVKDSLPANLNKSLFTNENTTINTDKQPSIDKELSKNLESFCESREEIIFPQIGITKNNEWRYIIQGLNIYDFNLKQGIRVQICINDGKKCKFDSLLPFGYTSTCVQKYGYTKLIAINGSNETDYENIKIPLYCVYIFHAKLFSFSDKIKYYNATNPSIYCRLKPASGKLIKYEIKKKQKNELLCFENKKIYEALHRVLEPGLKYSLQFMLSSKMQMVTAHNGALTEHLAKALIDIVERTMLTGIHLVESTTLESLVCRNVGINCDELQVYLYSK